MANKRKRRIRYEFQCPECNYHYWLEAFERPNWVKCPICGHNDETVEFLIVVECEICHQRFSGRLSNKHKKQTGDNSWTLLFPKEVKNG